MSNQNIIDNSLRLIKSCPVCNTQYTSKRASVVERTSSGTLLYFSCSKCWSSLLANIVEMPFGLIGSAMLTDLELNEVQKFNKISSVNINDVLETYRLLEK
ncbi:MAG TPA: hypothetical protein ENN45_02480 [Bacteroidetes bacterium]|nr:hypothetical protein [Bacteroidota bacterium]